MLFSYDQFTYGYHNPSNLSQCGPSDLYIVQGQASGPCADVYNNISIKGDDIHQATKHCSKLSDVEHVESVHDIYVYIKANEIQYTFTKHWIFY